MTEEELRKQATSTVEWENTPLQDRPQFVHAYIVGVKSAESRIEKLEKENAKLKEQLGDKVMQKQKDKADLVWKLKTANEQKAAQLVKAKAILKEVLTILPKENIEGIYEITEEVEHFISKDKISMALKDPVLQQGFEIICKENTELKGKAVKWYKVADGDLPNNYRYVWTNAGAGYYDDGWWDDFGRLQGVIA